MKTQSEMRPDDGAVAKILYELVAELRLGRTARLIPLTYRVFSTVGLPWPVERERDFSFSSGTRVHVVWTQAGRVIEITRADGSWGVSCKGGRPLETDDVGVSDRLEVQKLCQKILADEGDDLEDAADQAERLAVRLDATLGTTTPVKEVEPTIDDPVAKALGILAADPRTPVTQIADRVGLNRQRLYEDPRFAQALRAIRESRQQRQPPQGSKDLDGTLEAEAPPATSGDIDAGDVTRLD